MLDAPSPDFLTDRVVVVPASDDLDALGAPTLEDTAQGVEHACAVQGSAASLAVNPGTSDEILGAEYRTLVFAADPRVVVAGQTIRWTHHAGVAFTRPILLRALAAARPPGGLAAAWRVDARRLTS